MASVSPPKPWERGGAAGASTGLLFPSQLVKSLSDYKIADILCASKVLPSSTGTSTGTSASNPTSTTLSSSTTPASGAPALPERPSTLMSAVNRNASAYSPYGANRLGTSPYGGIGSAYSSPYSRMGGMGGYGGYGSSMYGGMPGMGGYGSMYGGGMNGMYGGMGGMQGDPNDPNSLTHGFTQSTQATFQIIEGIVGAFGGFAQMLESTYMATHSSFFGKSLYGKGQNSYADSSSNGIRCRTIWESPKHARFSIRDLHYPTLAADALRKTYWETTTSRCDVSHTKRIREVRGTQIPPRWLTSFSSKTQQEAFVIFLGSCLRSAIPHG